MPDNPSFIDYKLKEWARDITSLASPLLLLSIPFIFLGPNLIYFKLLIILFINEVLGSIVKIIFPKKRPDGQSYQNIMEKIDAGSFPSLHASRITIVYLTLFIQCTQVYVQVVVILLMVAVMLSRVILKRHFWVDIFGGFFIGLILFGLGSQYLY